MFNSLTGIHTSDNVTFGDRFDAATRSYAIMWPDTFAGDPSRGVSRIGTQNFSTGNDIDFKDPMTQQWSLTYERELDRRNSLRVTYSGFHSSDLTLAPDPDYMRGKTTNIPDHRVVSTLNWQVPFGRDRAFGVGMPAALDALIGDWTLSSIIQAQSGPHLTAFYTTHCGSGTNCYGNEKADAMSGQDPNDGPKTVAQWFNTGAFSAAAFRDASGRSIFAGRFGTAEKGAITGPGAWNVDLAAIKDFRMPAGLTLRANVFVTNLFNHANLGRPDTNVTSANYGRITTLNTNFALRTVVFGARLIF